MTPIFCYGTNDKLLRGECLATCDDPAGLCDLHCVQTVKALSTTDVVTRIVSPERRKCHTGLLVGPKVRLLAGLKRQKAVCGWRLASRALECVLWLPLLAVSP